jgi:uncharacterized protein (AIM24 family)
MMSVPVLLPTAKRDETYAGLTYHIEGELVPVLHLELGTEPVYFEHYILLWKDPRVEIQLHPLKGAFKRMVAGMPLVLTEARGPGRVAFSRDGVGHVFALHLEPGQSIEAREHQWLAATTSVDYSFTFQKGVTNILLGGTGMFVDTFTATSRPGIVFLHGYGNVFEIQLAPGEQIDLEPGAWIYRDPTVQMETVFQKLASGIFASTQIFWNRFTGPGRLALQSMYLAFETGSD